MSVRMSLLTALAAIFAAIAAPVGSRAPDVGQIEVGAIASPVRLYAGPVKNGVPVIEFEWTATETARLDQAVASIRFRDLPAGLVLAKGGLSGADGTDLGPVWCDTRLGEPLAGGYMSSCLRDRDGDGRLDQLWMVRLPILIGARGSAMSLLGQVGPADLTPISNVRLPRARMAVRLCLSDGNVGYIEQYAVNDDAWFETPAFVDKRPCKVFMRAVPGKVRIMGFPVEFHRASDGLAYRVTEP